MFSRSPTRSLTTSQGWNDPKRLPLGIAAFTSFMLGVIMWCMGMVETWYVGPLGKLIGATGTYLGSAARGNGS